MTEFIKPWSWVHTQNEEQKCARERMALFPANAETLFVARDIWVVSTNLLFHIRHTIELRPSLKFLAGGAAGRETLRLSGDTELVPEDARRIEGILAAAASFGTAIPTSNLHAVSYPVFAK